MVYTSGNRCNKNQATFASRIQLYMVSKMCILVKIIVNQKLSRSNPILSEITTNSMMFDCSKFQADLAYDFKLS